MLLNDGPSPGVSANEGGGTGEPSVQEDNCHSGHSCCRSTLSVSVSVSVSQLLLGLYLLQVNTVSVSVTTFVVAVETLTNYETIFF